MVLKKINIIVVLSLILASCTNEWDKHYEDPQGEMKTSDKGVWEYLQSVPEYSEFVQLVKSTQADTFFLKPQNFTIWAPSNGTMGDLTALSDSMKTIAVANHITQVNYSVAGFKDGLSLQAYSGKRLRLHEDPAVKGSFSINDSKVLETVMTCKDGMIHHIDKWLDLKPTIFDYLETSQYTLLREIIASYTDTVFDKEHSVETGTDFEGNITYDSVFYYRYKVLSSGAIDKDNGYYTVFLTPNSELEHEMSSYYDNIRAVTGFEPEEKDSVNLREWIMYSFIHKDLIDDYGKEDKLYSTSGVLWRTSYQKIIPSSKLEFSNGYVYEVADLYIPNRFIQRELANAIAPTYEVKPESVEMSVSGEVGEEDVTSSLSLVKASGSTARYLLSTIQLKSGPVEDVPDYDYSLTWQTARLDTSDQYVPAAMTPGEYKVEFTFVKTKEANQDFAVYVNDIYLNKVDMSTITELDKLQTVQLGRVEIPQSAGVKPLKITMKNLGKSWKKALAPFQISFKPTVNNY